MKTVCVIGIWHLGIINCVGFAEAGYRVIGVDFDAEKASNLQSSIPPLFEPGLEDLMKKHVASGNLLFTSKVEEVENADWVVIAYDSPVNEKDEVDISPVVNAANSIANFIKPSTPLIITSQLPLGSCGKIEKDLRIKNKSWKSGVVYTPENLRLGSAIERFMQPDMIIIGSDNAEATKSALELYEPFKTDKPIMNLKSAEMVKHALNTFLATSITFINEIANLSDRLGADAVAVGKALKLDKRIGNKALMMPGLGFSGGTLARDVMQLNAFAHELDYDAKLLDAIFSVNEGTFDEVVIKLQNRLGQLNEKRIGIMGLTYKPNTSTMRRSPAIKIINKLHDLGAQCMGYDPLASSKEMQEYEGLFTRAQTIEELVNGADALVLITEWPIFREVNYDSIGNIMKNKVIVDSKNYLHKEALLAAGFDYQGFGQS